MSPVALRLAAAALALGCAGCGPAAGEATVLRLGHELDTAHPVHRAMLHLDERLQALSGGTMRVEVFPSRQLGNERESLELLQIGSLAMTKVSASVLENFAPSASVLAVPYLFRDSAHQVTVLDGPIGDRLLASPARFRLRGLAFYDAGARSFYTVGRPVRSPADLDGLKVRTQESQSAIRMVRALGGSPTPISYGELYTALQQGVVDGAENNPPSFYLSRHYEVARHYALDEHTAVPDVLLISGPVWDGLTDQQQTWLRQAARESAEVQRVLWAEATAQALAAVREAGVEVTTVDKAPFRERVAPLVAELEADPELGGLIREIRQTGAPADGGDS
ncbi:TRAP transporter substrate-binding protein [Rubrivirga sp.]|uniref:TRAP transporter substrate-binding protein n=1 Tax=Rubrivirga sp. TaxID=1885344 RepID=UPI003B52BEDC